MVGVTSVDWATLQPTGKYLYRFLPTGEPDPSFHQDGAASISGFAMFVLVQPDGKVLVGTADPGNGKPIYFNVARYLPNGAPDLAFGVDGNAYISFGPSVFDRVTHAVLQPDGKSVIVGLRRLESMNFVIVAFRLNDDGSLDTGFGHQGMAVVTDPRPSGVAPSGIHLLPGSNLLLVVVAGSVIHFRRLDSMGQPDRGFGVEGVVEYPFGGQTGGFASGGAIQADGKLLLTSSVSHSFTNGKGQPAQVARFNPDGTFDRSFGEEGIATLAFQYYGSNFASAVSRIIVLPDGRIVLLGSRVKQGFGEQAVAARLDSAGRLDTTFGNGGWIAYAMSEPGGKFVDGLATPQGQVLALAEIVNERQGMNVISKTTALVRLTADDSAQPVPEGVVDVVEYYHEGFRHYFMTADRDEIAQLDAGAFGAAFIRTGRKISALGSPLPGTAPVCRFFTTSFAPKSSHFYTAYASECEGLRLNAHWQYEGITHHVRLPTAGSCPAGTTPVFRMYNNGQTGAPNHRFTIDTAIYQQFTSSRNWVPEGVVFCGP